MIISSYVSDLFPICVSASWVLSEIVIVFVIIDIVVIGVIFIVVGLANHCLPSCDFVNDTVKSPVALLLTAIGTSPRIRKYDIASESSANM